MCDPDNSPSSPHPLATETLVDPSPDPHVRKPLTVPPPVSQVSLGELFFFHELCAIGLGAYIYISPLLSLLAGSHYPGPGRDSLLGHRHFLIGGVIGFFSAMVASWLVCYLADVDSGTAVGIVLFAPIIGYLAGLALIGLSNDGQI